jgi:hypothetical protein
MQGHRPRTQQEFLAQVYWAQDRTDAVERQREREAAQQMGKPIPRLDRNQLKRDVAEREAAKETTPATQAELSKLSQAVTGLKSKIYAITGKSPV